MRQSAVRVVVTAKMPDAERRRQRRQKSAGVAAVSPERTAWALALAHAQRYAYVVAHHIRFHNALSREV